MKKMFGFVAVCLALSLALLSGCASRAPSAPQETAAAAASPAAYGEEAMSIDAASGGGYTAPVLPIDRKVVKRSSLRLESDRFDEAVAGISRLVNGCGGYIESQEIPGVSLNDPRPQPRRASIQARIPAQRLEEVVAAAGGLCNLLSRSERMDDITDTYFDVQARLKSLTLQESRLLAILEKATQLQDVLTLEQSLSETRYQIESLTSTMRRMDGQVSYSYLDISLSEVLAEEQAPTVNRWPLLALLAALAGGGIVWALLRSKRGATALPSDEKA